MPIEISCPSCASVLRVPDTMLGRLGRCPKCRSVVPIRDLQEGIDDNARERITEQPGRGIGRWHGESDEADSPARSRRPREEEPLEDDEDVVVDEYVEEEEPQSKRAKRKPLEDDLDEVVDEYVEEEEPRPKRRKKKRKKLRFHPLPNDEEERETPAWVWWAGGCAGILLTYLILIVIAMMAPPESYLKFCAMALIISLPISTVIFFGALIAASMIVGAVEIGEIHVSIFKSFGLILAVSIVCLIPFIGRYLTPLIWIPGLMLLFRLDFWETCMVMFFNWVPNFLLNLALTAMLLSGALHGGGGGGGMDRDQTPTRSRPAGESNVWDEEDVQDRGGWVEYDPNSRDLLIVVGISFRDTQISDADLAHMKDFPRLTRLDLGNTRITDAGLKHLTACRHLQGLDLRGTRVTEAGMNELRKALPNLQIFS